MSKAHDLPTNKIMEMTREERENFKAQQKMIGLTTPEKIRFYYHTPAKVTLDDSVKRIHDRANFLYQQMLAGETTTNVINSAIKKFGISRRQAFYALNMAIEVWGDIKKNKKAMERSIVDHMAKEIYKKAMSGDNPDLRAANNAAKTLMKAHNLDKEDIDLPDFSKLDPSIFPIILDPQGRKVANKIIERGIVNLSEIAEDIDFEEIGDEEE